MRRDVTLACALAALLLAGCGGGGDSRPSTRPQAVPKGQYGHPVKIQHAAGETFVPGRARKVIVLTPGALDSALALGVEPIGAARPDSGPLPSYLARRARRARGVGTVEHPDLRRIEALRSELILGHNRSQGRYYEQLRVIAPTVLAPIPRIGPGTPRQWKLDLRLDAESLGRIDAGETLLKRNDLLAARARRALGPAPRLRVAAIELLPGGAVRLAGLDSFAAAVLVDAGLVGPQPRGEYRQLSPARYGSIPRADATLVSVRRGASGDLARLRGALRGRVALVPDQVWWQGDGPLASAAALRELPGALRPAG